MVNINLLPLDEYFSSYSVIPTKDVEFYSDFRKYCEENLCGQYSVNYSCPPDCGEPEEMKNRFMQFEDALVLQTKWDITDYSDVKAIKEAKRKHNQSTLLAIEGIQKQGHETLMVGASCCNLCPVCKKRKGLPCVDPKRKFSCLSAYCIHASNLAKRCEMEYTCSDGKLALFSIVAMKK